MQEQLVNYETAKLAKEKGFDQHCNQYYFLGHAKPFNVWDKSTYNYIKVDQSQNMLVYAPTQHHLKMWLSKVHKLDVEPIVYTRPHYCVTIINEFNGITDVENPNPFFEDHPRAFLTYEEAFENGLIKALNLI